MTKLRKFLIAVLAAILLLIPPVFSVVIDLSSPVPISSWTASSSFPQRGQYLLGDGTWNQDGRDEDAWVSAAEGPDWVQVDLNDTYSISSIFINDGAYTDEINREPCSFSLESSIDANSWETQFTIADSGVANWNDDAPTSINKSVEFDARYVRISNAVSGVCGGDEKGVRFGEMIVYGDPTPIRKGFFNSIMGYITLSVILLSVLVFFVYSEILKKK